MIRSLMLGISAALFAGMLFSGCSGADENGPDLTMTQPPEAKVPPAADALARETFEKLKDLQGRWEGNLVAPGGQVSDVISEFRVTAEGHAVIERGIIGDPMETTTVYYMDRGVLRVTHYCAAGNQPRMYLNSSTSPERLAFSFDGVTNIDEAGDFHMRLRWIEVADDTELTVQWEGVRDGRILPAGPIQMRRVSSEDPLGASGLE